MNFIFKCVIWQHFDVSHGQKIVGDCLDSSPFNPILYSMRWHFAVCDVRKMRWKVRVLCCSLLPAARILCNSNFFLKVYLHSIIYTYPILLNSSTLSHCNCWHRILTYFSKYKVSYKVPMILTQHLRWISKTNHVWKISETAFDVYRN